MPETLRVAVIGQAFMGRAHSYGWARAAALPASRMEPKLTVLCGRDREALRDNAARLGFTSWTDDWRAAVSREDVDLVDVCTPGASHAEICLAALAAGKHVLCEKPLANSLEEARAVAVAGEQAAAQGIFGMVGFNYRRVPAIARARSIMAEGRLGELRHIRAVYLQDWLVDPSFPLTWRLEASQAGTGALGDLGAHLVDLVRYLSADELSELVAMLTTFVTERPLLPQRGRPAGDAPAAATMGRVTVDDACAVMARLNSGALVTLEASRMATGRKNGLVIEANGSRGSLRFELERLNELQFYEIGAGAEGFTTVLVTGPADPYIAQWWPPGHILGWEHSFVHEVQDLMAAIADGRQPEPSLSDGLATQAVLDAISRSCAQRAWVAVEQHP